MLPQEIIRIKRDGGRLTEAQIQRFIQGVTSGAVTEGQIAAFCMAVLFRGMDLDERVALTLAMTRSGTVLDWKPLNLPGPILDKHSTGGVGDKVSLILAPAIAACGGFVPMISGRGLGHTGGTLDKLDSIPGYTSLPDRPTLERVIRDVGCAIIGATDAFAPADKRVYAVRDITATVESLDLITASILSKKLAAGLDALVMDVKFGSGAFMAAFDDAVALAESIVTVATGAGMPTVALLTDMNEVLGRTAGNALEVRESIDFLTGAGHDPRLYEVTSALSAELLVLGGLAPDASTASKRFDEAISSGAAAERFSRMVASLGGPADLLENPDRYLPRPGRARSPRHHPRPYHRHRHPSARRRRRGAGRRSHPRPGPDRSGGRPVPGRRPRHPRRPPRPPPRHRPRPKRGRGGSGSRCDPLRLHRGRFRPHTDLPVARRLTC